MVVKREQLPELLRSWTCALCKCHKGGRRPPGWHVSGAMWGSWIFLRYFLFPQSSVHPSPMSFCKVWIKCYLLQKDFSESLKHSYTHTSVYSHCTVRGKGICIFVSGTGAYASSACFCFMRG